MCARNNLPYATNPDSRKILQTLSEHCEEYEQRMESETGEYRNYSEEENNADSENERENPREKKKFWQVQTRAQSKTKQMKLKDVSKERREEEVKT